MIHLAHPYLVNPPPVDVEYDTHRGEIRLIKPFVTITFADWWTFIDHWGAEETSASLRIHVV